MRERREAQAKEVAFASGAEPAIGATAGALLVAARERRGLSVEAVAQQLKLSARQVRALEEGDFTLLPGRTYVRGFVRNYARLVALDPEYVLDALPGSAATPTLAAPTLHPTAPTRGELPTSERTKAPWTRWAIPVSLAAVVATAGIYEWARPAVANRTQSTVRDSNAVSPVPAQPPVAEKIESPLPNPLSGGPAAPTTQNTTPAAPAGAQGVAPSSPEPLETKGTTNAS